ncbi:hypothetical protein KI387_037963 [Taxus chinensis]|uniref:Uncharacterized protein n=1 Tax=Taxus chinensis TaxID=29808 RepID=A0AA38FSU8_TAXCH|nr:hypothetical protein KI387_037963 [Taxus chinensis]
MEAPILSFVSDLRVKRERVMLIPPQKVTERRSMFLSNIDQKFVHYIQQYVDFFSAHPQIPFDVVIDVQKEALGRIQDAYDVISGRLGFNSEQGRFEIDCNAAGAPVAICTSELSLEDLGDVSYPNPAFTQLCLLSDSANRILEDEPLISFQITRFTCGGFALGTALNHSLMDGFALQEFAKNFTNMAIKGELAFVPVNDRTCLKARSPLQINYEHEEFITPSETNQDDILSSFMMQRSKDLWHTKVALNKPSEKHVFRLFLLSREMLEKLKMKAKNGGIENCTSFIAPVAHLWRAKTAAMPNMKEDDISTIQYAVDIRSRLVSPLPPEFTGNRCLPTYMKATFKELKEQPFYETVKKLQEGVDRLTNNYVMSAIDWLELYDGVVCLENGFLVSSWKHMQFGDVELGGGIKSLHGGPVVSGWADIVLFLPHPKDHEGIQIYIGLEPSQMVIFKNLIEKIDGYPISP